MRLTEIFPIKIGIDKMWLHGFFCALSYLPYAIVSHFWPGFILRLIICSLTMGYLNYIVNKKRVPHSDWIEECFRGFVLAITLLLLKSI